MIEEPFKDPKFSKYRQTKSKLDKTFYINYFKTIFSSKKSNSSAP